jgi:hypothetical protein
MAEDAGLLEAPTEAVAEIDNSVADAVDISPDSGETGESDIGGENLTGEVSLKGSALWREVKSLTQEGKPLTPKQLSALNKVIHRNDAFESKYPDGLSAVEAQMTAVKQLFSDESVPFEQAIQETVKEQAYYHKLDTLFSDGKPEFVEELASTSPEAFQNIAPAVFRKYAEVNPEGYSAYVAQAVVNHMNSARVPMQFEVLDAFWPQVPDFPGKQQFQKALAAVIDWSDSLKGMAAAKISPKVIPGQENGQQGPDLAQQNEQLKVENSRIQWNSSIYSEGVSFVMSEAQKAAGKTVLTDADKQKVLKLVGEEMEARLTADRRYGEAMQGYLKAGNRNSYLQRIQSERKKLIPGAVRRAVGDVIEARPKNAPKQAQAAPTGQKKPTLAPELNGAVQFMRIAKPPKEMGLQVDHGPGKTTHAMLERRQAFVVGRKQPVTWGK